MKFAVFRQLDIQLVACHDMVIGQHPLTLRPEAIPLHLTDYPALVGWYLGALIASLPVAAACGMGWLKGGMFRLYLSPKPTTDLLLVYLFMWCRGPNLSNMSGKLLCQATVPLNLRRGSCHYMWRAATKGAGDLCSYIIQQERTLGRGGDRTAWVSWAHTESAGQCCTHHLQLACTGAS